MKADKMAKTIARGQISPTTNPNVAMRQTKRKGRPSFAMGTPEFFKSA